MHIAIKIFLAALIANVVSWIGKSVLLELAFSTYASIFLRSTYTRQRSLKKSILETKAELVKTSSQDQFAKWAKLKRKVDKGLADLEKLNGQLATSRTSLTSLLSTLLFILTSLLPLSLIWYYRRTPVFYLPAGWAPPPLRWLAAFGGGGKLGEGGVSVTAWSAVCRGVIGQVEGVVRELVVDGWKAGKAATPSTQPQPTEKAKDKRKVLAAPIPISPDEVPEQEKMD